MPRIVGFFVEVSQKEGELDLLSRRFGASLQPETEQLGAAFDSEAAIEALDVAMEGVWTNVEMAGRLLFRAAFFQQFQHLALPERH